MSIHSPVEVREPDPALPPVTNQATDVSSFDARWAVWVERGRQHSIELRRKLGIALLGAVIVGILVALFLVAAAAQ